MSIEQDLRAARVLIEDPAHWTRGEPARNKHGDPTSVENPEATRWCALGALYRVTVNSDRYAAAYRALTDQVGVGMVSLFNDSRTHLEVLELFDKAIAAAGEY